MKILLLALIACEAGGPLSAQANTAEGKDQVAEILARPLFSTSRRPAQSPEGAADSMPVLTGIAEDGHVLTALFRLPGQARVMRAHDGQNVSGWKIQALSATAATLERNGQSIVLRLDFRHAPPQ